MKAVAHPCQNHISPQATCPTIFYRAAPSKPLGLTPLAKPHCTTLLHRSRQHATPHHAILYRSTPTCQSHPPPSHSWEQLGSALPQIFTSLGLWACSDLYDVTSCNSRSRGPKALSTNLPALLQRLASKGNSAREQAVVSQYYTDDLLMRVAKMYSEDMSRFGFNLDDYKR